MILLLKTQVISGLWCDSHALCIPKLIKKKYTAWEHNPTRDYISHKMCFLLQFRCVKRRFREDRVALLHTLLKQAIFCI